MSTRTTKVARRNRFERSRRWGKTTPIGHKPGKHHVMRRGK